jgi:DNA end-binding protein Ku
MRSMWKGAVSFGLVMIPVKLYTATEQKDIAFRQVHREDGGRIRFKRFCTVDDQEVPYEDIAKGYELPDGDVVVLTEEDMAELPLATTKSIDVVQFCPTEQLDPILFNKSYYLEPEAVGIRAYCLLRDALEQSGRIAVAQVALRQRESLAVLRARDGVLVLETLLWPDEVREPAFGFLDDNIEVRPQELRMAASLIDSMTVDFDPDEFHDGYREALQELVAAKTEGREVMQPVEAVAEAGEVTSLADALRASLAAAKSGSGSVADPDDEEVDEAQPAPRTRRTTPMKPAPAKTPAAKTAPAKTASGKTTATRSTAAKTTAAKSTAAKSTAAKSTAAKSTAAKTTAAKTTAAKTDAAQPKTAAARKTTARSTAAAKDPETTARPRKRAS